MRLSLLGVAGVLAIDSFGAPATACERRSDCRGELDGDLTTPTDDSVHCVVDASTCTRSGICDCLVEAHSPYGLEWWYWTAHLRTSEGQWYGFAEVVYTAIDLESYLPLTWADHTLSDLDAGRYYFGGRETEIGLPQYVPNGFEFAFPSATIEGGGGRDRIHSVIAQDGRVFEVDLKLKSRKRPVQQRADGLVSYYSRERMSVRGSLTVDGKKHGVRGSAWFDHQFGDQRVAYQNVQTWSWFALQLDDNRELVVYDVEVPDWDPLYPGGVVEGTLTDEKCQVTHLGRDDFEITALGEWVSPWMPDGWPETLQCIYPMGWHISVPAEGIDVVVEPFFPEQEIIVPEDPDDLVVGDRYWEGAALVSGTHNGRAYVEMMGYCPFSAW